MIKDVLFVAVTATGVQPLVVFSVKRGVNGGSMQTVWETVLIPQEFLTTNDILNLLFTHQDMEKL